MLTTADNGDMLLEGLAPAPIYFTATGGAFTGGNSLPCYDPNFGVIPRGSAANNTEFDMRATPANSTTEIEGDATNTTFVVSSDAGQQFLPGGDLSDIQGHLTLIGGAGSGNRLIVGDVGDGGVGTNNVILTTTNIGGTSYQQIQNFAGPASSSNINYTAGGSFNDFVGGQDQYDGILLLGSRYGSNAFNVQNTPQGSSTAIDPGDGADNVIVSSTADVTGALAGAPLGILDAIAGDLTIHAGAGLANRLIISDQGQTATAKSNVIQTTVSFGRENYQQIQNFAPALINYTATGGFADLSQGSDEGDGALLVGSNTLPTTFNIRSTLARSSTTLDAGLFTGNAYSVFDIGRPSPNTGGILDNIAGPLTLNGSGQDVTNVDDSGSSSSKTGVLTATTLTGLGTAGIAYQGRRSLNIALGSGNDSFTLAGTDPTSTNINTGAGDDTVTIQSVAGNTLVQGGSGNDTFVVGGTGPTIKPGGSVTLVGGSGGSSSFLSGGAGGDTIIGGADNDTIYGNGGADVIVAGGSHDLIYAVNRSGTGDTGAVSYLYGTFAGQTGAGTDTLFGSKGNDFLFGSGDSITAGDAGSIIDNSLASSPAVTVPPVPTPELGPLPL